MKQTFLQKTKRFLAPIKETPWVYIRSFFIFMLWGLWGIIHVLALQSITHTLEVKNQDLFQIFVISYGLYLFLSESFFFLVEKYSWPYLYNTTINNTQKYILKDYIHIENNTIESIWTGKLVSILQGGNNTWSDLLFNFIFQVPRLLVTVIFTFVMLSIANMAYGIIFVILYIVFHILASYFNKKAIVFRKKRIAVSEKYTKDFVKVLMSKNEILQSEKIDKEIKNLDKYGEEEIFYNKKMAYPMYFMYTIPEFWMNILLLFAFFYLGTQVLSDSMTIANFVGITGVIILMNKTLNESTTAYKDFTKDFPKIQKLWDFFDEAPVIEWYDKWKEFVYKKWDIEFEKVSYEYVKWKNILEDFSFKVNWWSITAFVWPSGWWKSTMAKLIWWYIQADKWEILVDWQKLSEVSLKSYYKNIWYLTQEPSVFDGTVLENLTYARDNEVTKQEIKEAIEMAKCEFIYELPNWLETEIWERWVKLSGWQRQRLAIAKIILKNPKIVILDEPTSALDSFSEEQITIALNNLFKERTVIVIAHRLQTVKHADKIFLIEDGKITEEGTHISLQEKWWLYAKMLELQSGF